LIQGSIHIAALPQPLKVSANRDLPGDSYDFSIDPLTRAFIVGGSNRGFQPGMADFLNGSKDSCAF
jgi:hypothetical protein